MIDARGTWTLLQFLAQVTELLTRACRHHFNIAILAVAHPAGDTKLRRFALHKPAEADALHATGYNVAAGFEIVSHGESALGSWHLAIGFSN